MSWLFRAMVIDDHIYPTLKELEFEAFFSVICLWIDKYCVDHDISQEEKMKNMEIVLATMEAVHNELGEIDKTDWKEA